MTELLRELLLTCPICGHAETLIMPTEACQGWDGLLRLKESTRHPSPESAIGFLISTHLPYSIHTQA